LENTDMFPELADFPLIRDHLIPPKTKGRP
jgi:hypothetical protein